VRSVTKSVVSTLVGIAVQERHIASLDQPITDFLRVPEYDVNVEHALVHIRHLLTMTAGFEWSERATEDYNAWILSDDHIAYVLERPISSPPGTSFVYNSGTVHMLGVILEEATGTSLPQYADRVLFGPLGISERVWEPLLQGQVNGGAGIDLRPRDLARLGQLFLQRGWSGNRAVVPAEWVAEATVRRFADLGGSGPIGTLSYGYLWWADVDNDAYMAWGYGGQFVYVVPSLSLVVVATTDWRGVTQDIGTERLTEEVLKVIVERVLPAAR
jgi:CubicO group peptidase (beta-lactamase class C family)